MSAGSSTTSSNAPILPAYDKTPLSHLLELAVQKTYQELYTMPDMYIYIIHYCFINLSVIFFCFSLSSKTNLER